MENEELNLDNLEVQAEEKLKVKNRFEKLSEKVIQEKAEKETLAKAKDEALQKAIEIGKERDFYKDFSANVSKYPSASEYQDKILEKVKSGYSTEDAMVSVLAKEGKLNSPAPVQRPSPQVEGGSSPTIIEGGKTIGEMTVAEKFAALSEADKTGELQNALRGR